MLNGCDDDGRMEGEEETGMVDKGLNEGAVELGYDDGYVVDGIAVGYRVIFVDCNCKFQPIVALNHCTPATRSIPVM